MTYPLSSQQAITGAVPNAADVPVITPDSNQTWTTDQVLSGMIRRTLTATARSDTTPTAAALVAALKGAVAGTFFYLDVVRTDAAAVALTVVGGTGVTIVGTATIAASTARAFLVVITNVTAGSEAVKLYSEGASTA